MKEENKELVQRLRKFSKEQIIGAILESYPGSLYLERLINNLEYRNKQDLLAKHSAAIDAERQAAGAYMDWRREMYDKYRCGGRNRLKDIPADEIKKGEKLKREWREAVEKECSLDKQVNKMLGIEGKRNE